MKIYTKTGDRGTTGLFGGGRVDKDDPRVEAYGTVDELNAVLGVALAAGGPNGIDVLLFRIQEELFIVGSELATLPGNEEKLPMKLVGEAHVAELERSIDEMEAALPPLTTFILPGGSLAGALLHQARTVCRRAERAALAAAKSTMIRAEILIYLNRLSDFLFVASRRANQLASSPDVPWTPRGT